MADDASSQQSYQQTTQQPAVSYLTNPTYNPTIVVHHHHGTTVNVILMAATATLVTLLCLFIVGITFYLVRRRRRRKSKKMEEAADCCSSIGEHIGMIRSVYDSDRDMDSFRHSKATCDTCSTRFRTTRPAVSHSPTTQRHSHQARSSLYLLNEPPIQSSDISSGTRRVSVRLDQALLSTSMLEESLGKPIGPEKGDHKGGFDWDRCAFELQEEEAMWLPKRPAFASRQPLSRGQSFAHNRSASESATLSPPPRIHLVPSNSISRSQHRATWTDSPLSLESPIDYFAGQNTAESSVASPSAGYSPGLMASMASAGSSEYSLLMPASPYLVHTPQRQSYCVRAETQDWENQIDTVECLSNGPVLHRSSDQQSQSPSISSAHSHATGFSDPFGVSRTDLHSDFVVLSRPSPSRSEQSLPSVQEAETPIEAARERVLSVRSATSPAISSPLRVKSDTLESDANAHALCTSEILIRKAAITSDSGSQRRSQRVRSATISSGEVYPLGIPLQTHRFSRRGALVAANLPANPITAPDYASSK